MDQEKQDTENATLNYLDKYISDIKLSLEQYTIQETEAAKDKVRSKGAEIESALDVEKKTILGNSKTKIKVKIDSDLNETLFELDNELSIKIQEKLK